MPAIHWAAVNPATGLPIAELPGTRCNSSLTTLMGASGGTVNITLPITDRLPPNWRQATTPHRVLIVAQFDDDNETVLWAGIPVIRSYGSGATIELTCTDIHGYADRVSQTFAQTFDGWPLYELGRWLLSGGITDYLPKTSEFTDSGPAVNFSWPADETAYRALLRLATTHPFEWTVEWVWADRGEGTEWGGTRRLWAFMTVGEQVGRQATTVEPFAFGGAEWTRTEDWTAGRGATQVVAVGLNAGDGDPPVAAWPTINTDPMRLVHIIQSDNDTVDALRAEAQQQHDQLRDGTVVYDVALPVAESDILLGKHVGLGDDVIVDLANPDRPDMDHTQPARMVGWTAEPDPESGQITTLRPILVAREP